MTFTHFLNCTILTYAPIYVIFSAKNLHDQPIGKFFLWGLLYYTISTLTKMLLYATVIPYNIIETESYNLSQEGLKIVINLIEIFFLILTLKNKSNFIDGKETGLKVIVVALSWALAENLFSYFLFFLTNATSDEFSWEYLQIAIKANIDLFERIAIVALVEAYRLLQENKKVNLHIFFLLLLKYSLSVAGEKYIPFLKSDNEWVLVKNRSVICVMFCLVSRIVFNSSCVYDEVKKTN